MNDLSREKLDVELCRLHEKLKTLDPTTEAYKTCAEQVVKLTTLANTDDEARNKYDIEKDKLDAEKNKLELEKDRLDVEKDRFDYEANLEASKKEFEMQKMEFERKQKDVEARRTYIQLGITSVVTLATFAGTWIANSISQYRSEYFESTGHAYTSRFSRFQLKEPMHPGVKR